MRASAPELLTATALCGAALLLVAVCWRRRAILGLLCGGLGLAAALAALLGATGRPGDALAGSLAALAVGTVLLMLGGFVQRLLDAEPVDDHAD